MRIIDAASKIWGGQWGPTKKKLDFFTLETSKNHPIRNFLRNGRVRVKSKSLPLRSFGVVFDSRESLDLDIFELVGSGVGFCDNNRIVVFEMFAQFHVGGLKRFAVTAPRSIEFNKY